MVLGRVVVLALWNACLDVRGLQGFMIPNQTLQRGNRVMTLQLCASLAMANVLHTAQWQTRLKLLTQKACVRDPSMTL